LTREEARVPRFTKLIQSVIGYKLTKLVSFNPDTEYQNDIVKIRMNQNDEKKKFKIMKKIIIIIIKKKDRKIRK